MRKFAVMALAVMLLVAITSGARAELVVYQDLFPNECYVGNSSE